MTHTHNDQVMAPANNSTGLSETNTHLLQGKDALRPPVPAWISKELIDDTIQVYSPLYGRTITEDDAIGILTNIRNYAEVLLHIHKEAP